MTIEHTELFDSRENTLEVGKSSIDLRFGVWGSEDESEITSYLDEILGTVDGIPEAYRGIPFQSLRQTPLGNGLWVATATYATEIQRKIGDDVNTFQVTTGTKHIEQSIATMYSAKADGVVDAPPDFKGLIGVNNDRVEGVDILTGSFSFSITRYFRDEDITNEYWVKIADMSPSVNNAPFRGFQAGEVLFHSANGSQRANLEWEITFQFSVQRNVDDFVVQGFSENPISKDGWDYIWFVYQTQTGTNNRIKQPKYLYIERVYDRTDFSDLGIGV